MKSSRRIVCSAAVKSVLSTTRISTAPTQRSPSRRSASRNAIVSPCSRSTIGPPRTDVPWTSLKAQRNPMNTSLSNAVGIEAAHGVAGSPDGTRLYVTNEAERSVDVVDMTTLDGANQAHVIERIQLSGGPHNIAISRDGRTVYAAMQHDATGIDVIDTETLTWVKNIPLNDRPEGRGEAGENVSRGSSSPTWRRSWTRLSKRSASSRTGLCRLGRKGEWRGYEGTDPHESSLAGRVTDRCGGLTHGPTFRPQLQSRDRPHRGGGGWLRVGVVLVGPRKEDESFSVAERWHT